MAGLQLVLKFRERYNTATREEFDQLVASLNAQVPASISAAVAAGKSSGASGGAITGTSLLIDPGPSTIKGPLTTGLLTAPAIQTSIGNIISAAGFFEQSRATALGDWITIPYSAGIFTASGSMVWSPVPATIATLAYTLIGHTALVFFNLSGPLTGTGSTDLFIQMPFTVSISTVSTVRSGTGVGGTPWYPTITYFTIPGNKLGFQISAGGNFVTGGGQYYVQGTAFCQVA